MGRPSMTRSVKRTRLYNQGDESYSDAGKESPTFSANETDAVEVTESPAASVAKPSKKAKKTKAKTTSARAKRQS